MKSIKLSLLKLEAAIQDALTRFFVMMGDGESPEFWHENQDLKPIPIPVRQQVKRPQDRY